MKLNLQHTSTLDELTERLPVFRKLEKLEIEQNASRRWTRQNGEPPSHDLLVLFIGKTGYGKSSTINAFAGFDVCDVSDVAACTRHAESVEYSIREGHYLGLVDMPGVGESRNKDEAYLRLYGDHIAKADAIVYVVRADCRDFAVDERVFKRLLSEPETRNKTIVAMNQSDQLATDWKKKDPEPSPAMKKLIAAKKREVISSLPGTEQVIAYSAARNWGLDKLSKAIVTRLVEASTGASQASRRIRQVATSPSTVAKTALNPAAAWPFPTRSRPE